MAGRNRNAHFRASDKRERCRRRQYGGLQEPLGVRPAMRNPKLGHSGTGSKLTDDDGAIRYAVQGAHDGFPSYELYGDSAPMWQFAPASQADATALFPPLDVNVAVFGTLP